MLQEKKSKRHHMHVIIICNNPIVRSNLTICLRLMHLLVNCLHNVIVQKVSCIEQRTIRSNSPAINKEVVNCTVMTMNLWFGFLQEVGLNI